MIVTVKGWPLKHWQAGRIMYVPFPVIFIRKGVERTGILAHEQTHVRQWRKRPLTHWIRYKFNPQYRREAEAEAYANQINAGGINIDAAAHYLVLNYGLSISHAKAVEVIEEFMNGR